MDGKDGEHGKAHEPDGQENVCVNGIFGA